MGKNYEHVEYNDRLQIEVLYRAGHSIREIAVLTEFSYPTIWREINVRGVYIHRNSDWTEEKRYSAELAQRCCDENKKTHGKELKIGNDLQFVQYVEKKILEEKKSPEAILYDIKKEGNIFATKICKGTLYNYLRNGIFLNVGMEDLPMPRIKKKKEKAMKVQKRASRGTSIEKRPKEIQERKELGHWEMDTVVGPRGKSKYAFLVLTERKTLKEIVEPLKDHTAKEVIAAMNRLEREMGEKKLREVFKSITVDKLYYCHAYCSCE